MPKQKLLILQGLPASGKTTYAKELVDKEGYKRINKDDLRAMIDNGKWSDKNEKSIIETRNKTIISFLESGYNVVVDDTNFSKKHIETFRSFTDLPFINIELEIKLIDTPLYECIERDARRPNPVGKRVILNMYNQYLYKVPEDIRDESLPTCIICDIDGTLAYMNGRTPYKYDKVSSDKPNQNLIDILHFIPERNIPIFIFSGRESSCRQETSYWLYLNNVPYKELFMRDEGDSRDDTIVKEEMYNKYIKGKYNVLAVFDDRPKVVRMWQRLGLFVMQCGRRDHRIDF